MTHSIHARLAGIVAIGGLLLAVAVAPSVAFAAQPAAEAGGTTVEEQPTDGQPTDGQPTDEGEVVYDPIFITPTPDATPIGEVRGITSRPDVTPPPTDALAGPRGTTTDTGVQAVLLALAALSSMVLLVGRVPGARRR